MKEANIEQAIKQGVKAVSSHWIMACDEQKQRLPEVEFPPGYDPKRALDISGMCSVLHKANGGAKIAP